MNVLASVLELSDTRGDSSCNKHIDMIRTHYRAIILSNKLNCNCCRNFVYVLRINFNFSLPVNIRSIPEAFLSNPVDISSIADDKMIWFN